MIMAKRIIKQEVEKSKLLKGYGSWLYCTELTKEEIMVIKTKWEKYFIPANINKDKIYLDDFLWHVFSYEVKDNQTGENAIHRFDEVNKDSIYLFYQFRDKGYLIEKDSDLSNVDLDNFIDGFEEMDLYIVDTQFKWTYVKTHEEPHIGPFFAECN